MKIAHTLLLICLSLDTVYSIPCTKLEKNLDLADSLRRKDLFDGDIILRKPSEDEESGDTYYSAVINDKHKWSTRIIPYEIDIKLASAMGLIDSAFKIFHDKTCIRFQSRREEKDYVYIHNGDGCNSMVGRAGGRQPLSLSLDGGCNQIGIILHELMHVIGFYHEHSRSDRDDYIDVHLENVIDGYRHNFDKLDASENYLYEPFNYFSIMIYGEYSFSKNSHPTMTAKNGIKLTDPYQKQALTQADIRAIQTLYRC